jgi:hypothetical protein
MNVIVRVIPRQTYILALIIIIYNIVGGNGGSLFASTTPRKFPKVKSNKMPICFDLDMENYFRECEWALQQPTLLNQAIDLNYGLKSSTS